MTENHLRVPVPVGTSKTNLVIDSFNSADFEQASQSWKAVCYSTPARKQVQWQQVLGIVKTTKPVRLQCFSTASVHGNTKIWENQIRHILIAEPTTKNS